MKLTVSAKSWLLTIAVALALLAVMLVGLFTLKTAANLDNRARLEQLLRSTTNTIAQFEEMEKSGKLDAATAKALAAQVLRTNKYHPSEYVYVTDEKLAFVAAPGDPDIHGKGFGEIIGNDVAAILQQAIDGSGGKLIAYPWTSKAKDGTIVNLLSIAQQTPRWKWVVGNGVSFAEADARFWASARWQVLICLGLAAAVGGVVVITMRGLRMALGGEPDVAVRVAQAIAAGDLTMQIDSRTPPKSVLGAVGSMQSSLRAIIEGIQNSSVALSDASHGLKEQMDQVSHAAQSVSDYTAATAAAVEEMSVSIDHISNSAMETTQNSERSSALAATGEGMVNGAAKEIGKVAEQVDDASKRIAGLVERSRAIGGIAKVIKEIADQTNLLALNAAIESARAGEQGRGFAVVADEVRKLAERTTAATAQIAEMIKGIQSDTGAVVAGMEAVTPQMAKGVTMTTAAASTLRDISTAALHALERNRDVSRATVEQSQAGSEIAGNVERIAQMAESSAEAVMNANAGLRSLEQLASELQASVSRFRL